MLLWKQLLILTLGILFSVLSGESPVLSSFPRILIYLIITIFVNVFWKTVLKKPLAIWADIAVIWGKRQSPLRSCRSLFLQNYLSTEFILASFILLQRYIQDRNTSPSGYFGDHDSWETFQFMVLKGFHV